MYPSAVATHARAARDREALLGTDRVHDALPLVRHAKVAQIKLLHVLLHGEHLLSALVVLDEGLDVGKLLARVGRHVVVDSHQRAVGSPHGAPRHLEALEGLR